MDNRLETFDSGYAAHVVALAGFLLRTCCCCDFWSPEPREDARTSGQHLLDRTAGASPSSHLPTVEVCASPSRPGGPRETRTHKARVQRALDEGRLPPLLPRVPSAMDSIPFRKGNASMSMLQSDSRLSLIDDGNECPTCLEPYSSDAPKCVTQCGHHFHLHCIYSWLERSQSCPICERRMAFDPTP